MLIDPTIKRPILRYHGGKWKLAPWIVGHFPSHKVYVEPFGGAASVLLRKPRSYAEVYNDLDGDVVNVFQVLRNEKLAAKLKRQLELTPFARAEFDLAYLPSSDPVERARRMVIRSIAGIGTESCFRKTGWRKTTGANNVRLRNVARDWTAYPCQIDLFTERLRGVIVEQRDFADVIKFNDSPSTLFYVDPPYMPETRERPTRYAHELSANDHIRLAEVLCNVRGMVVLSGYPSQLYRDLFSDWRTVDCRAVAHGGAASRTERLWIKPWTS
jgi:DNA adenine methylase